MWYLKENPALADTKTFPEQDRLTETYRLTKVSRDLCAFQVLFMDIAKPVGMSFKDITERYDKHFGLPTTEMEKQMKEVVQKIPQAQNYPEWFALIKLPVPNKSQFAAMLAKTVESASTKDGYFDKGKGRGGNNTNNRGGYNNNQGGRGRGRGY
jgi:hypothetical protein